MWMFVVRITAARAERFDHLYKLYNYSPSLPYDKAKSIQFRSHRHTKESILTAGPFKKMPTKIKIIIF